MELLADDVVNTIMLECDLDSLVDLRSACKDMKNRIDNLVNKLCTRDKLLPLTNFYHYALFYSKDRYSRYSYMFYNDITLQAFKIRSGIEDLDENNIYNAICLYESIRRNDSELSKRIWNKCKRKLRVEMTDDKIKPTVYNVLNAVKNSSIEMIDYFVSEIKENMDQNWRGGLVLCDAIRTGNEYIIRSFWDWGRKGAGKRDLFCAAVHRCDINMVQGICKSNDDELKLANTIDMKWLDKLLIHGDACIFFNLFLRTGRLDMCEYVLNIRHYRIWDNVAKNVSELGLTKWLTEKYKEKGIEYEDFDQNAYLYSKKYYSVEDLKYYREHYQCKGFTSENLIECLRIGNYEYAKYIIDFNLGRVKDKVWKFVCTRQNGSVGSITFDSITPESSISEEECEEKNVVTTVIEDTYTCDNHSNSSNSHDSHVGICSISNEECNHNSEDESKCGGSCSYSSDEVSGDDPRWTSGVTSIYPRTNNISLGLYRMSLCLLPEQDTKTVTNTILNSTDINPDILRYLLSKYENKLDINKIYSHFVTDQVKVILGFMCQNNTQF